MGKQYITAVIEIPEDPAVRKAVTGALSMFSDFHGGTVTALYAGDAIGENEIYAQNADPSLVRMVRDQAITRREKALSFCDVLHTRERVGHIDRMRQLAQTLGYAYFLWNDRVYKAADDSYNDIGLTAGDVA